MNDYIKGTIAAIIAAVAYGLNPFFALPLYAEGYNVDSVIFYRYSFSIIILAIMLLTKRISFAINKKELFAVMFLGAMFSTSSLTLFESFQHMDAGIACTILFVYPIMVAVAMALFFKERLSLLSYLCIGFSFVGLLLLYKGGDAPLSLFGILLVVISSLSYAIYIIAVNKSSVKDMNPIKLTFWALVFGLIIVGAKVFLGTGLQTIQGGAAWFNILGLAIAPTAISLITIAIAIRKIGSTLTSIISSFEPITALLIGIFVFHETMTMRIAIGVIIILISVTTIVVGKRNN